jgi:polyisoprenoid-binding protein YceI
MLAQETLARYRIDPAMSRLTVKVSAGGLLAGFGHNPTIAMRDCSGEADFGGENLERAALRLTVRPESCEVTDDVSQKDKLEIETRMKQEVLETSRYPEIVFESTVVSPTQMGEGQYAANIVGNLALHGVTRSQTIICRVALSGEMLRGSGEFTLRQSDYGIKLVSVAGGTLKVKDEIKCSFDIMARKQA